MTRRQHCGRAARNGRRCVAGPPLAAGVVVGTSDPAAPGDFVSAGTFVRTQAGSSSKKDFYFGVTVLTLWIVFQDLQWATNVIPTIRSILMHDLANEIEFAKDIYFLGIQDRI